VIFVRKYSQSWRSLLKGIGLPVIIRENDKSKISGQNIWARDSTKIMILVMLN
jgi:hypothetical protein